MYYLSKSSSIYQYLESGWIRDSRAIGGASGDTMWVNFIIHLLPLFKWLRRCSWGLWSRKIGDALADNEDMNMEDLINWVSSCTRSPCLSMFWNALQGDNPGSLKIHLQAMIMQNERYTWRSLLCKFADGFRGHGCANLDGVIKQV